MKHRTFTAEDQNAFAELSGDYNPLHIDALSARRFLYGSTVVHGIHALLWGLDCYLEDRLEHVEVRLIKTTFTKPIKVGEEVSLSLANDNGGRVSINLKSNGSIVTRIKVELHKSSLRHFDYLEACSPKKLQPRILLDDEIESNSGTLELCLNVEMATKMFPHLIRCISPLQISVILSTTRLVGVICPGMNSLYSELELVSTAINQNTSMNYEVTNFDRRFGLILMKIIAPEMAGVIKAFRRPIPQKQANYVSLKHQVDSNEFAGQCALIIGGSRGLGEVAAKLLSGGGADVKITYHQGQDDARHIVDDIVSSGGVADSFHFDVLSSKIDPHDTPMNDWIPTHLYYFATPFIFSGVKGIFSPQLFDRFCDYYVAGFMNTISEFGVMNIFYPSTVAIDEVPTDMGEYIAAKIASEMLCTFVEKNSRGMKIYKPRFPRMATDQTVSIIPVNNLDPVSIILKELRYFRDLSARN